MINCNRDRNTFLNLDPPIPIYFCYLFLTFIRGKFMHNSSSYTDSGECVCDIYWIFHTFLPILFHFSYSMGDQGTDEEWTHLLTPTLCHE